MILTIVTRCLAIQDPSSPPKWMAHKEMDSNHYSKFIFFQIFYVRFTRLIISLFLSVSDQTKHTILVVSVFLFVVAFLVCLATLVIWAIARRKKKGAGGSMETKGNQTTAELACDEKALSGR